MELSPEVISMIASGPLGVWIVGQWITRSMKRIDNIPDLVNQLVAIEKAMIKVEVKLEQLTAKKDENREEIIKLRENAKAVWRNIDELKLQSKAQPL